MCAFASLCFVVDFPLCCVQLPLVDTSRRKTSPAHAQFPRPMKLMGHAIRFAHRVSQMVEKGDDRAFLRMHPEPRKAGTLCYLSQENIHA